LVGVRPICEKDKKGRQKAMKTTQGWGWLVAGVLALGCNGFYQDGGAAWAHRAVDGVAARIADRSDVLADLAATRVDGLMERASVRAVRDKTVSCPLATAMARFQSKAARTQSARSRFESMSPRQEAALAQGEAHRAQTAAQVARVYLTPVAFNMEEIPLAVCPRVRLNVSRGNVSRVPVVRVRTPVVQLDLGDGPI
jgi:hypothetical protein